MNETEGKEGLAARARALQLFESVIRQGRQLDDALFRGGAAADLHGRDAALAHAIAAATLRHHGQLSAVLASLLSKPLPRASGSAHDILLTGLAQLLVLRSSSPAAINLSVEMAKIDKGARHFAGLVNAVLREAQRKQPALGSPLLNLPEWLVPRLSVAYGDDTTAAIAEAHTRQAPLDLSLKPGALSPGGELLPTGTVRIAEAAQNVVDLPGFSEGAWWIQDAAAAMPVRLLGPEISGLTAIDLCAAPGGKTAQLASLGAKVTAIDISKFRMQRLRQNMERLDFDVECRVADIRKLPRGPRYDIVVLDAPCSATGTMRRHPDLAHVKSASQIDRLAAIQRDFLEIAADMVNPGGSLLYCVCSLLPAEGEAQANQFLSTHPTFTLRAGEAALLGGESQFLSREGYLRTLPSMPIGSSHGLDGFFAARFVRH